MMMLAKPIRLLVINPNTSKSITNSLKPMFSSLNLPNISVSYWTSSYGPAILKTQEDNKESAAQCLVPLLKIADAYDGFLIACYADHLLTPLLQSYVGCKPVIDFFGASITTALQLTGPNSKFAILTTGIAYEAILTEGVKRVMNADKSTQNLSRFGGVFATDVSVDDLQEQSRTVLENKIITTTRRLVRSGDISVVCMGGIILAGLEDLVQEACILELGTEKGHAIKVLDQIIASVMTLQGLPEFGSRAI